MLFENLENTFWDCLKKTLTFTIKTLYSGQQIFLKKVSAITTCPLYKGFQVIFTGSIFCDFNVYWTILQKLVPAKIIAKLLFCKIRKT